MSESEATGLAKAIDNNTVNKPVCYMANCVHPSIVYTALSHIVRFTIANVEEIVSLAGDLFVLFIAVVYFVQSLKNRQKVSV